MLREDNFCVSCAVSHTSQFDAEKFMNIVRAVLPSLNTQDNYIRSGLFIHPSARDFVSSFKCCGSSVTENSRIEVIQLQLSTDVNVQGAFDCATELICRHLIETKCDAAFVAAVSANGNGWRTALVRAPRFCAFEIPADIVKYMTEKLLREYLQKHCELTEGEVYACLPKDELLFDDSGLREKARIIDASLRAIRFCDPAVGNGQLVNALINKIVALRMRLNKFFTHRPERTEQRFLKHLLENSLCVTDCDCGAVETFKLEMRLNVPDAEFDDRIVWGSILFEDLFGRRHFNAVISNPPHLKQDYFFFIKQELEDYKCNEQNADIYCYYVERSFSLLEEGGTACLLTSNRWMRNDYGRGLREFLTGKNVLEIVDYGNIPVIDGTNMSMSLITVENSPASGKVRFVSSETENAVSDLASFAEENSSTLDASALSADRWRLAPSEVSALLAKIESRGVPLEEYVGKKKLFRGILTGCNKAFTMSCEEAEVLIAKDAKYAEVLKPFLSGRNVKRYAAPAVKKYLICIPRGFTDAHRGTQDGEEWFAENYFDLALYLSNFQNIAENRRDRGNYWWELRSFKHYEELAQPKIICPTIVNRVSVTMDCNGLYSNDKTSVIASEDYYLLGLLNSRMMNFWFRQKSGALLNGYYELKPADLARMPIMKISPTRKNACKLRDVIANSARQLLTVYADGKKNLPPEEKATALEIECILNASVEKLYRLTAAEIKITDNF